VIVISFSPAFFDYDDDYDNDNEKDETLTPDT